MATNLINDLRTALIRIGKEYPSAREQPLRGHALAEFIKKGLPVTIAPALLGFTGFRAEGSPGKGNWAKAPWLAVFDPLVTETAQRGYYPVYLFNGSLDAVYLSFNQGVRSLRLELGVASARKRLRGTAGILLARARKLRTTATFSEGEIELGLSDGNYELYEQGHVLGRRYEVAALPPNPELLADLTEMLRLYSGVTQAGGDVEFESDHGSDDSEPTKLEEAKRFRLHRRYERNSKLAAEAKRIHGSTCQVCGFEYSARYPGIGDGFIEAHHRVPLSELLKGPGTPWLSARDDFAVLCANCHRMIHRPGAPRCFEDFVQWYRSIGADALEDLQIEPVGEENTDDPEALSLDDAEHVDWLHGKRPRRKAT
jgi:5-methylcytosine-specific restriction protein A